MKNLRFWGNSSSFVLKLAGFGLVLDQLIKYWIVHVHEFGAFGLTPVLPFLDLVLVWNKGISYGLFQQESLMGQIFLAGFTVAASIALWLWSVRSTSRIELWALALILGGALGNGVDRVVYGKVVDYIYFHVGTFSWYVFNLADVLIVVGAAIMVFESIILGKGKDS
nr:signal peptidase II [Pseudovibrio hongkongensis]